ncbi:MAG: hypothetical protein L0K12_15525 [Brevibacterium aurantiacum]|nr:hypothetical protein [Brevibacterium aurantiacum]MDN6374311.1 hypothetical protein [Brevibacterium aurantiacum]
MEDLDRGLQPEATDLRAAVHGPQMMFASGDERRIPSVRVLVAEGNESAVLAAASREPGGGEVNEGGESVRFAVSGTQFGEQPRQIEGLADGAIARLGGRMHPVDGEGTVDRLMDVGQTRLELGAIRQPESDAQGCDPLFRPGQAPGDGRCRQSHTRCDLLPGHTHDR